MEQNFIRRSERVPRASRRRHLVETDLSWFYFNFSSDSSPAAWKTAIVLVRECFSFFKIKVLNYLRLRLSTFLCCDLLIVSHDVTWGLFFLLECEKKNFFQNYWTRSVEVSVLPISTLKQRSLNEKRKKEVSKTQTHKTLMTPDDDIITTTTDSP